MALNAKYNPYDFANPVSQTELFVGRKVEMADISYYLRNNFYAPTPIHLAILGARAAGKTSFLNIIQKAAVDLGYCAVRINLDESDSASPNSLFIKLLDSIFISAVRGGAFNGIEGKTYDVYLDMRYSGKIPSDKLFCPLLSPMYYAKATASSTGEFIISDAAFEADLSTIATEVKKPIILLFDECNVLSQNRVNLEKLRNIFMNMKGYMLVFTGTEDFFPVMDDVFSPIMRQFKKVFVKEFDKEQSTIECIGSPLQSAAIEPDEVLEDDWHESLAPDIHKLSGGRPYEIQLICHILFKRVQNGQTSKMRLDVASLEAIRMELEGSQQMQNRPLTNEIRKLSKENLRTISEICPTTQRLTLSQIRESWVIGDRAESGWEQVLESVDKLKEVGIVTERDGVLSFSGDDFDRIYVKCYCKELGLSVQIHDNSVNHWMHINLQRNFRGLVDNKVSISATLLNTVGDVEAQFLRMFNPSDEEDVFEKYPDLCGMVYIGAAAMNPERAFSILILQLDLSWNQGKFFYFGDADGYAQFVEAARRIKERMTAGNMQFNVVETSADWFPTILAKLLRSENVSFRLLAADNHVSNLARAYFKGDLASAQYNAEAALKLDPTCKANNLGYFLMATGDLTRAEEVFDRNLSQNPDRENRRLVLYNRGMLRFKKGQLELATSDFRDAVVEAGLEEVMGCLLVIVRQEDSAIAVKEMQKVGILWAMAEANSVLLAN
jgi:hypothetical protein